MEQLPENPDARQWQGRLHLVFARQGDRTQLIRDRVRAPLKVQRPFYPEGSEVCHSVTLHTAGGIVGGDLLDSTIRLEPDSRALITTAAAGKVYRSNGLTARQTVNLNVGTRACLEWLPQETILFNGADYRQDLRVELAPQAHWLGWEILRLGRTARGEKFVRGNWRSHTEVWRDGVPLWIDRQWLPGREDIFESSHGLAGQPVVASLVWVGGVADSEIVTAARSKFTPLPALSTANPPEIGVTRLGEGLVCRYRGRSVREVRHWFTTVWDLLRSSYLGRPACPPRVWFL
ncbi:MAG: urease accessory protein UreD [Cyanobacteriota bacterium]|nr:urease accessory protein UreD [Cyanobacteriota bacterium]